MIISYLKQRNSDHRLIKFFLHNAIKQCSWSTKQQQLISSSFKRLRNFAKFLSNNYSLLLFSKKILPNKNVITLSKNLYSQSKIIRHLFRNTVNVERYYFGNSFIKTFNNNHRVLIRGTTGLSFGLIGIYHRDDNGNPVWSDNNCAQKIRNLDFREYFKSIKDPLFDSDEIRDDIDKTEYIQFNDFISKGCCGAVHKGKIRSNDDYSDVAIKMLFNFDMSSNSMAIIRESIKECVPYRGRFGFDVSDLKRTIISPHPNIVKILSAFVDELKPIGNSSKMNYKFALPPTYGGFGHTRTLFIMQKLYDMSLKQYLISNPFPEEYCSLAILTQCFEAIDFLNKNQISHRDIKPDNFLVELSKIENDFPWIVITDFGLCSTKLRIPFESDEVCKGGNRALMAPEIKKAQPNKHEMLDYTKADLWSMATIAYEIFGHVNPFYREQMNGSGLDSAYYSDSQTPEFESDLPLLSSMIKKILRNNPEERPSIGLVSAYCHLLLQYGSQKLQTLLKLKNYEMKNQFLRQWFKKLSYKKLYEMIDDDKSEYSNNYRMQIIFLSKYSDIQLIDILNESCNEFY